MSNGNGGAKKIIKCSKCNGKGTLPRHKGIDNGRCFRCAGAGRVSADVASAIAATQPQCMDSHLGMGDGSGRYLVAVTNEAMRPSQLAAVAALLQGDRVAALREVAARLAILDYPKATTRARAHYAGMEAEFDAAVATYQAAIASDPYPYY